MEHKFKVGDRVRCIDDAQGHPLQQGKEYVVTEIANRAIADLLMLEGITDSYGFYPSRFELVIPEPTDEELAEMLRKSFKEYQYSQGELIKRGWLVYYKGPISSGKFKITKTSTVEI